MANIGNTTVITKSNKENKLYSTVSILGAVRLTTAEKLTQTEAPQQRIAYDLTKKEYKHSVVPIELNTGGPADLIFTNGKQN